ncbi:MAG: hypothetical protein LAO76_26340 [Acidobacteriia bacterium]|nr:hypothetical protein [Terriglobia bacterium]
MPENGKPAVEMKDVSATSFGYVIGFLLPGMLGLYALGFWFPEVHSLLQPATSKDATLGPSFFLLLSALTVGLLVGGIRFYVFQEWICRKHKLGHEMFKGLTGDRLTSFKAVVDEHYRYHQFYGGCAVAMPVMFAGWMRDKWTTAGSAHIIFWVGGFLLLEGFLIVTAQGCFVDYSGRSKVIVAHLQEEAGREKLATVSTVK